ncbi:hypothetical protein PHYSODRAFT_318519 [Phytophthora sojae]|uniref:Uncharacterized protein n=1 Tax=Phytophthora sojae (strain P6497) TaxID=1094619 RepID=G5A3G0_PHYSP|nr:hypothetical protein PHYSODRAFT_318519 [Phytophthora sojae]EGZ10176.1 hypothetical protein PHYSODRAFT_318519 [Phytophthora sojae]|eukprot:XP_009535037.1 hypothetical protein PHYSODRAFT_318519 [Phytophthora sojae]
MVADAEGHRVHEPRRRELADSTSDAAKSPLLRRHFRTKLLTLATSDCQLQYTEWLEFALMDNELAQLMQWDTTRRRSGGMLRMKTRSVSFWSMTPIQPALSRASSDSLLQRQPSVKRVSKTSEREVEERPEQTRVHGQNEDANNFGVSSAPFLKSPGSSVNGRRQVTLLSRKMNKKFKACWPPAESEALVRNPFEEPSANTGIPYVFWCQCTIS